MTLLVIIAAVVVGAVVVTLLSRANEIFYVSIRGGRCLVVRGSVPPSLFSEIRAIVRMTGARRGSVRALREGGSARVVAEGLGEGTEQRLRNAFGARGFHRPTGGAAAPSARRNLGQLLGVAWLAWLLTSRGP